LSDHKSFEAFRSVFFQYYLLSFTIMWLPRSALLSCFILGFATAGNITQSTVCGELASVLPDQIYFPDAPTYNASITSYPFLQLRLHPSCIVRPKSSQDVSVALEILKQRNGTRFAVKGGGHNANAGFNNIDNGVTFDMQSMRNVEVERGDKVVRVAAGALSQDAYDAAEKRNLTVLAGRIGVVGTAGFLIGGMCNVYNQARYAFRHFLTDILGRRRLVSISTIWLGVRRDRKFSSCSCEWRNRQCERDVSL
jgi:opacity protein-like surface antigen